jgi:hypothetical protein
MFSEEIPRVKREISETDKEFVEADHADLIIVLMEGAPGAIAEVCTMGIAQFGRKFCVMVPKEYKDGFVANGPLRDLSEKYGGDIFWYTKEDLAACNVKGRALKQATAIRYKRYREKKGLRMWRVLRARNGSLPRCSLSPKRCLSYGCSIGGCARRSKASGRISASILG